MKDLRTPASVDRALAARIVAVLVTLSVALLFAKVRTIVRWLTPAALPPAHALEDVQYIVRHVDGVLRRAPFLLHGHCLLRSLTLYYFCTRLGYPVQISFGVRQKPDGTLDGHGWLLLQDRPFMERGMSEKDFVPIWRLPTSTPDVRLG